jgi:L-iditol 2-dehydrogenase
MWAMTLTAPGVFSRIEAPRPTADDLVPGQVLLRVTAGGICGSDLPYLRGARSPFAVADAPTSIGFPLHEVAGQVLASRDDRLHAGDQVVGWAESFDGLAELVVTGAESLFRYDPALKPTSAVLMQPLACVLYAVERLGDVRNRNCAVLGLGPIGALFSHVLAARGAAHVVGVDPVDRRDVGSRFGLDEVVVGQSGPWAEGLSDTDRPEVVVEAVGHQVATLQDALVAVRPAGSIFYFGVHDSPIYPLDMDRMIRKHLTLRAGGTLERPRMLAEAGAYLAEHPCLTDDVVTHVYDATGVQDAYDQAARPAAGRLKVCLDLSDPQPIGG